jgi:hypothetical protein
MEYLLNIADTVGIGGNSFKHSELEFFILLYN